MYELIIDGGLYSKFDSLEKALKERNRLVREFIYDLYNDGQIDKYAVEDWLWDLDNYKELYMYIDECRGREFKILICE